MNIPAAPTVHTAIDTYSLVLAGSTVESMYEHDVNRCTQSTLPLYDSHNDR